MTILASLMSKYHYNLMYLILLTEQSLQNSHTGFAYAGINFLYLLEYSTKNSTKKENSVF